MAHSLRGEGSDASEGGTGRGTPIVPECAGPLTTSPTGMEGTEGVESARVIPAAFAENSRSEDGTGRGTPLVPSVANPLTHRVHKGINTTLDEGQTPIPVAFHNRQDPDISGDVTHPLGSMDNGMAVAFDMRGREGGAMPEGPHDTANIRAADGGSSRSYVAQPMAVRRLTVEECEALQGFPRGFTRIPWRGKEPEDCPDGPRYKALGNSMAVNCMEWLGQRIQMIEEVVNDT